MWERVVNKIILDRYCSIEYDEIYDIQAIQQYKLTNY